MLAMNLKKKTFLVTYLKNSTFHTNKVNHVSNLFCAYIADNVKNANLKHHCFVCNKLSL